VRSLPEHGLAVTIYGTILVSAVLVAISEGESGAGEMVGAVFVTSFVFALSHAWSETLARSAETRKPVGIAAFRESLRQEWPMVQAAVPAAIALTLAWVGLYSAATGVSVAIAINVTQLFVWGAALRHLAGGGAVRVIASGFLTAFFGVILVLLKVLIH
jgi:hypothetical protein